MAQLSLLSPLTFYISFFFALTHAVVVEKGNCKTQSKEGGRGTTSYVNTLG